MIGFFQGGLILSRWRLIFCKIPWCIWVFWSSDNVKCQFDFIDIAFPSMPLQLDQGFNHWLIIVRRFVMLDCLSICGGLRTYYYLSCFMKRNIVLAFEYFLFLSPTLTRSWINRMVSTTIGTFIREITIINMVIRILLTTFPANILSSTVILKMSIPLAFITS